MPAPSRMGAIASLTILALTLAPGATALPVNDVEPSVLRASIEKQLAEVRELTDRVRQSGTDGSVLGAVEAVAIAADREAVLDRARVTPTPNGADEAIDSVVGAVEAASGLGYRVSPGLLRKAIALMRAPLTAGADLPDVEPLDPSPALAAAARIAAAIDSSLPTLRSTRVSGDAAAECDVLQNEGVCVGGQGPNTYVSAFDVIIDLGGDDQYNTTAGARTTGAALVLDVAGNDRYTTVSVAAQGSGGVGGLGMLVDAAGQDVYTRTGPPGAGQGVGVFGGVGLLVDLGGSDGYTITGSAHGVSGSASGQGTGVLGGIGALIDVGGSESYSIAGTSLPSTGMGADGEPRSLLGTASGAGQGLASLGGVGVLIDSGGDDQFELEANMPPVDPEAPPVLNPSPETALQAITNGQGSGIAGVGMLITGAGATTYDQRVEAGPVPTSSDEVALDVNGQGLGAVGALGVLSDAEGSDTYNAVGILRSGVAATANDGCGGCPGPSESHTGSANVFAQGYAVDAVGLLDDGGSSSDRYTLSGSVESRMVVTDDRTAPAGPLAGMAAASPLEVIGQGGASGPGIAALVDTGGSEVYSAAASSRVFAESAGASPKPPGLTALPSTATVTAQGAGWGRVLSVNGASQWGPDASGALIDLQGSDRYSSEVSSEGHAGGELVPGEASQFVQGAGREIGGLPAFGLSFDIDGTGTDTYVQVPAVPACTGTRGQAVWRDCGGLGIGFNA